MNPDITAASGVDDNIAGSGPEVSASLEPTKKSKFAIRDEAQAIAVAHALREQAKDIIKNAAIITHVLNGQPVYDPAALKAAGRSWYPSTSTRFLRNQCSPIPSRLFMPVLTATYLTAAELPAGWPLGPTKSQTFRELVTEAVRAWPAWHWFNKKLATEAGFFGYGFAVWFDEWEWRPTFVRCTRGFVPIGTQIDDENGPSLFCVAYDYRVDELLEVVENARTRGRAADWDMEAVQAAINAASTKPKSDQQENARENAEMVREATIGDTYEKAYRVISTLHLFSIDPDGTVSHQIVLDDAAKSKDQQDGSKASRQLFERRAQFDSMWDVVTPMMFDPETGTIHGSWGACQHLFDLAQEYERSFCDWVASMKLSSKIKTQVNPGVNPEEARLQVDDVQCLLSGAQYAGNIAATPTDPKPFQALLEGFGASAREIIGNYIPPIPLTPSDVKAAQVDAKVKEQQERREQTLHMLLQQDARKQRSINRRITKKGSPLEDVKELREDLKAQGLTDEEIEKLADQPPIRTIFDYTTFAIEKQAAFLAAKQGNPFYNAAQSERTQALAVGGWAFAEAHLLPGDDATTERMARRQQQIETGIMMTSEVMDVLPQDNDFLHLQTLRPKIEQLVTGGGDPNIIQILLNHAVSHFVGATNKKGWPQGYSGNKEKAFLNKVAGFLRTGTLPEGGLADDPDPIGEMEQQMRAEPVLSGPGELPPSAQSGADAAGLESLVSSE